MNRNKLKKLANIRLKEAEILLTNDSYPGAYYLLGYAIECGLKACIAKHTKRYDFPNLKTVQDSWNHDFTKLVKTAGLEPSLNQEIKNDQFFAIYWNVVKDWSAESRYQEYTRLEATNLHSAITDNLHGVLKWIKQHW